MARRGKAGLATLVGDIMVSSDDGAADRSRQPSEPPIEKGRLSKFEGIIISRERVFDVLATIITAIFTVVLALSTVLLWKETKDLRNFAEQQSEDMKASIAEAARSAAAMGDVAKVLAAEAEMGRANIRAYITTGLGAVVPQNKDTNYRYEVRITMQNVGNTPAYKVASNLYTDVLPNPLPSDFEIPAFNPAMTGQTSVGPHQNLFVTAIAPRIYSDDEVNQFQHGDGKKLLYVFGTITYEDVFGASRYIKLCQMILWFANGTQMTLNTGKYNESN
jgi:hypothetical protein